MIQDETCAHRLGAPVGPDAKALEDVATACVTRNKPRAAGLDIARSMLVMLVRDFLGTEAFNWIQYTCNEK